MLATRTMIGEMERAGAKLLRPHVQPGQLSVGVRVEVEHTTPTPVGARVVTRARYLGMECGSACNFDPLSRGIGVQI